MHEVMIGVTCNSVPFIFFFFNATATTEIYTLPYTTLFRSRTDHGVGQEFPGAGNPRSQLHQPEGRDRKSTRLNSSHSSISYAVFCLKKKNLRLARAHRSYPTAGASPRLAAHGHHPAT